MSLHDAVVRRLIIDKDEFNQPARCVVCSEPIMHSVDPRTLTVGTVFLWDGAEHTVTWTHHEPIRCALQVNTDKGAELYFTKHSENVTVIL